MGRIPSTISKKLIILELDIRSFSKINIDKNWLDDLHKLTRTYNVKYIMAELKEIRTMMQNIVLLHIQTLEAQHSFKYMPIQLKLNYYNNIIQLRKVLTRFRFLLDLKPYLLNRIQLINLPTKKPKINTLKSPHVFKKAQDHYELQHHKLLLRLPVLYMGNDFISCLVEKTTKLNSLYRVNLRRKNIYLIKKVEK